MGALVDYLTSILGDLGNWLSKLDIGDILSGTIGVIPRAIIFFRVLLTPIYDFVGSYFGIMAGALMFACIGFICILAMRRGVFK